MASTVKQSPLNSSGMATPANHAYRSLQTEFETLPGEENPLVSLIGYGEAVLLNEDRTVTTIVDKQPPQTLSLTAQVIDSGTTLTLSTHDAALLQIGHLLLIDEEIMRVTTIAASTTVGVERDFAGTTIATHVTSSVVHVMSPVHTDGASFVTSPFYRGEMKSFYPFRTQKGWEATSFSTAIKSYLTKGKTDVEYETTVRRMTATQAELERLLLYSKAQQMTSSAPGAPDGIYRLITSNVNPVTGLLTATDLVDTMELIYSHDSKNSEFLLVGNRNTKRIFNAIMNQYFDRRGETTTDKVGVKVDVFETDLGTMKFLTNPQSVRDGELYILNISDLKLHPLDIRDGTGSGWVEFEQGPEELNSRAKRKVYEWQGVFIMGDERRHGLISGFTTTGSSYAGYV